MADFGDSGWFRTRRDPPNNYDPAEYGCNWVIPKLPKLVVEQSIISYAERRRERERERGREEEEGEKGGESRGY